MPADLVLLTTSEESGECYLDTAGLDGETNLKRKETQPDIFEIIEKFKKTMHMGLAPALEQVSKTGLVTIDFEFPNTNLEAFKGSVMRKNSSLKDGQLTGVIPLKHKNVLLRGCTLRNTKHVVGMIVYVVVQSDTM